MAEASTTMANSAYTAARPPPLWPSSFCLSRMRSRPMPSPHPIRPALRVRIQPRTLVKYSPSDASTASPTTRRMGQSGRRIHGREGRRSANGNGNGNGNGKRLQQPERGQIPFQAQAKRARKPIHALLPETSKAIMQAKRRFLASNPSSGTNQRLFRPDADAQAKNPRSANSSLETKLSNRARTRIAGQKTEICEHDASNSPAKPKSEHHPSPARPFSFAPASLPRPPSGRTPYSRALTESEPQPHP